jgi:hypothetical protein
MFAVYQVFDARAITPALKAYWRDYYLPVDQGFGASIDMIQSRFAELSPYLGLGPAWLVAALGSAGLVTIVCLGRVTVAVTLLLLIPAMISLSALKKYPLLDLRTSTFLLVLIEVTATIGVCGICALVVRRAALAGAVAIVPVIASLTQTHTFLRSHTIPPEDVRSQVRYVAGHRAPRDVILVDYASNWGFAYYWRQTVPEWHSTSTLGYVVSYPATQRIVVAADRTSAAIDSVVSQALTMRRAVPGTRIWLVRSHFRTAESKTWDQLLTAAGLSASRIDAAGLELFQAAKQPEGFR